jgi:hypothetical protein
MGTGNNEDVVGSCTVNGAPPLETAGMKSFTIREAGVMEEVSTNQICGIRRDRRG